VKFLVDNQLAKILCRFLASRGVECEHVLDVGLAKATDEQIWRHAGDNGQIVISKDEDFAHLAARVKCGARFVWVRLGTCRSPALLTAFDGVWRRLEASLLAGDEIVEIR